MRPAFMTQHSRPAAFIQYSNFIQYLHKLNIRRAIKELAVMTNQST